MNIFIDQASQFTDKTVTIRGWIYNMRSSGSIAFLQVRDGSGFMQAVVSKSEVEESIWNIVEGLTQESSVKLTGKITRHPKQDDVFEMQVESVGVFQKSEEYPISLKDHGPDFLLDNRHLWLRSKKQWAILRLRDVITTAISEYLHQENFIRVDSPVFTPNACEGTTTLFPVPYFDLGDVYLTQSGQLYAEAAIASVGRCYDFGPVFRAEKSKTKRHLTEFWMMDAESAFVEHEENMDIQEGLVKHIVAKVLSSCKKELDILERNTETLQKIVDKPFVRYTYTEAIQKLNELGSDIKYGEDLGNDDEGMLTKDSDVPIFVERWPAEIKPFYMKRDETGKIALNNDLIATEGGGEIAGGSQREDNYEELLKRIKEEDLSEEDFAWYLDLRKYGSVPHSGFGFGLERLVRWMSGVQHVRECIPFPRVVNRVKP
ncbi:MAG: asparagine--tRNA ligase [Candidatus Magasanikbacteria bacterium CG_4_9_14_3_um_filter_32_9]|uniref:Asparagine--tRNA ligase n=1 Tax=Candidatus Magasanikbacteria bacterium CG_4_9_14_3_um_filter_32_9 TaxID=1974644 RepID=A0A2M7Z636_9BACT|nr:MAG: asparagine--tRNA ligase [Candidatus Magasanikbacteria bacterium CG_4_9_14_3_um_filter_32_9]